MIDWKRFDEVTPTVDEWVLGAWYDPHGPRPHLVLASFRVFRASDRTLWVDEDTQEDFYPITDTERRPTWWATMPNAPEDCPC